jgi:uncharacterized protein YndB with AHSA1/START domain/catechol 2,3-dioxygenase-like lactoylglutathione lyase family enzyme
MTTRTHVHEEVFPAVPEAVFALLHTPSAIRAWWGAHRAIVLPQPGGVWAATWGASEDDPDYVTVARIAAFDPPRRLVLGDYRYRARSGPLPFDADFVTTFEVEPVPDGAVLRVSQAGFPAAAAADDFYAACQRGWRDTFAGIRRYLAAQSSPAARALVTAGGGRDEVPRRLEEIQPVLGSRDVAASIAFYVNRLGFALVFHAAAHPAYAVLRRDDVELHVQWNDAANQGGGDRPMYRVLVSGIDALHAEFAAAGVFHAGTALRDTPWGTREFAFYDPDRNGLTFYVPAG